MVCGMAKPFPALKKMEVEEGGIQKSCNEMLEIFDLSGKVD